MRHPGIFLMAILLSFSACVPTPVPVEADLTLDQLEDKKEYVGALVVDGSSYMGNPVDRIELNGSQSPVNAIQLNSAGYYRIEIFQEESRRTGPALVRVVILDPERGETEWGLPPWIPENPENGSLGNQSVTLLHAPAAPLDLAIPMVVVLEGELTLSDSYLDAAIASVGFRIKRGVGSVQIPPLGSDYDVTIGQANFQLHIQNMDAPPQNLSGELSADLDVPAGSYLHIPADLTITEGVTVRIDSGCFFTVAPEINIHNNGTVVLNGTAGAPVTFTCSVEDAFWGGFIGNSSGNRIEASHTIFSKSGFHTGGDYAYGHAGRQALFYSENGELKLDHCYMIDHIGQIFYPLSCTLDLSDCLVQRVKTGGQMNQSELLMNRCVFTDFPDDSDNYRDEDNDGLYLNECNASISNSVFMYAKDDGLDSGASGGGEVYINNCRFEANYHEGAALSSGSTVIKLHHFRNSVFTNNGQGLELGYSSPNHQVIADSCTFYRNGVGIRFGDCYDWGNYRGYIHVQNSFSLENNYYDVWNMNRKDWAADTSHMSFENVYVSTPDPIYPELIVYE